MTTAIDSYRSPDGSSAQVWRDRDGVWTMGVWDTRRAGVADARMTFRDEAAARRALQAWARDRGVQS